MSSFLNHLLRFWSACCTESKLRLGKAMLGLGTSGGLFRSVFGPGLSGSDDLESVKAGDRFYQTGQVPVVWQVERICAAGTFNEPHAVIVRKGTVLDSKTLSVQTLLDETQYRRNKRHPD